MKAIVALGAVLALSLGLSGCDQLESKLGIEDAAAKAAKQDGEGKAVGGACRQSGRAIEDCYSLYNWLPKASVFAGWREMDAYMRDNKLETVKPVLPPPPPPEDPKAKKKKKAADAAPAAAPADGAPAASSEGDKGAASGDEAKTGGEGKS